VLGILDTTNEGIDARITEARIDDDGTDHLTGWLQQHVAAIDHVHHVLHRGIVVGILVGVAELGQREVITEFDVFH